MTEMHSVLAGMQTAMLSGYVVQTDKMVLSAFVVQTVKIVSFVLCKLHHVCCENSILFAV